MTPYRDSNHHICGSARLVEQCRCTEDKACEWHAWLFHERHQPLAWLLTSFLIILACCLVNGVIMTTKSRAVIVIAVLWHGAMALSAGCVSWRILRRYRRSHYLAVKWEDEPLPIDEVGNE